MQAIDLAQDTSRNEEERNERGTLEPVDARKRRQRIVAHLQHLSTGIRPIAEPVIRSLERRAFFRRNHSGHLELYQRPLVLVPPDGGSVRACAALDRGGRLPNHICNERLLLDFRAKHDRQNRFGVVEPMNCVEDLGLDEDLHLDSEDDAIRTICAPYPMPRLSNCSHILSTTNHTLENAGSSRESRCVSSMQSPEHNFLYPIINSQQKSDMCS